MNRILAPALCLIIATGCFAILAQSARTSAKHEEKANLSSFLNREYDLRPKYKKGDTRYYRLRIVYNQKSPSGMVASRAEHRGDFQRTVESVEPGGKAHERITWSNATVRNAPGATDPYGPPEALKWMEGLAYGYSSEDPYGDFPDSASRARFPATMPGYMSFMMTVDAHYEFDSLRSSYHGAIEKLRRIGDEVEAPDSTQPFTLNLAPMVPKSDIQKHYVFTKFLGLTYAGGEPCALIAHRQGPGNFWLDLALSPTETRRTDVVSSFAGNLVVRLSDGSLVHGDFNEHVVTKFPSPGQTAANYSYTLAEYNLDEISREEYLRKPVAGGQ